MRLLLEEVLEEAGAAELVRRKAEAPRGAPLLAHHRFRISISGCPNSCSQPQIADFGLSGQLSPRLEKGEVSQASIDACREGALAASAGGAVLDESLCVSCGACVRASNGSGLDAGPRGWKVMAGGRLGRHPGLAHEVTEYASGERAARLLEVLLRVWESNGLPGERVGLALERLAGGGSVAAVLLDQGRAEI
jgi:dissimilatory sulfite reductase (desulfoviridin) alpha/beta subunit